MLMQVIVVADVYSGFVFRLSDNKLAYYII
jgi:hypothetical protein